MRDTRGLRRLRGLVLAVFVGGLVAGSLPPEAAGEERADRPEEGYQWGEEVEGVRLGLRLEKREFGPMETVALEVVVQSVTADASVSGARPVLHMLDLQLHRNDHAMEWTAYGRELLEKGRRTMGNPYMESKELPLPAGSRLRYRLPLNRVLDMTLSGEYELVVQTKSVDVQRGGKVQTVLLSSKKIGITVRDDEWRFVLPR